MGTIFREYKANNRDRSIEDRRRHKELVEKSIKENIGSIISEESIIGKSKNKKIKIPIKGLKEYYFKYGKNQKDVVAGSGQEEKGQKVPKGEYSKGTGENGAGSEEGEDIYETEVTIEEAIDFLFEDLNLPYLQHKKFNEIQTEYGSKRSGVREKGPRQRLSKKHTMVEKIKRQKQELKARAELGLEKEIERIPFHKEDLRYFYRRPKFKRDSNAVVICIMDTSGSMGQTKKYLARSFYFLLYQFLLIRYVNVEIVFIAHTTVAKEVSEQDFFHKGESGGTYISSGYQKALDIIEERYHPQNWNIYAFHCSDGDNWGEDNEEAVKLASQLCKTCNLFGYGEIKTSTYTSTIMNRYMEDIHAPNFTAVRILRKEDVWTAFVEMLKVEGKGAGREEG
ncbi:sporulation protein YhbH [Sporanaerobium hydrogeniformans]|uniref:Sporulation protein YhbH n=1 Tax=Sporanaerobium hydrogeniformans TaxID=3072179 RepID=A0AC61DID5_9FIRM|nr:sporulation protein YhbH [Sporanaerobium hydrogeniformans]PHV71897.1 sporulation protein YhbH [Sporanaerobium hydrogeniformans]